MQPHRSFRLFVYARHGTFYLYCSNVNKTQRISSLKETRCFIDRYHSLSRRFNPRGSSLFYSFMMELRDAYAMGRKPSEGSPMGAWMWKMKPLPSSSLTI